MVNRYTNTASVATLTGDISSGAATASLQSFSGWPSQVPFWAEIDRNTASAEVVLVAAVAGNDVTIDRGQDGTVAAAHSTGATFEHVIPAELPNKVESHVAAATAHGTSSAIVGRDDAVTLASKTYRGHGLHKFSDANPAGVSAGFRAEADSGIARDGFEVANTAADNDRRAFALDQSGTPRHEVFMDGSVRVAPNPSAVRPGLRNEADTELAGPLSVSGPSTLADVTADDVSAATLDVSGASTLASVTASGDVSAVNVNASGTVDAATVDADNLTVGATQVFPQTPPDVQRFTSSGTWNKPAGALWVKVQVQAGGASGGGCGATGATEAAEAGAGGGGQYQEAVIPSSLLGASEAVTVGAGGVGASSGANDGNDGGVSSFGVHVTANGGAKGQGAPGGNGNSTRLGGAGGTGGSFGPSVTGLSVPGGRGGVGRRIVGDNVVHANVGGGAHLGGTAPMTQSNHPGTPGAQYGGGSSGANSGNSQAGRFSLSGAGGIVIVTTYFSG